MKIGYEYGEIEIYDFISTKNGTESVTMIDDSGWRILKDYMGKDVVGTKSAIYNYYSPALQFFRIWRQFHGNGMIWKRKTFICGIIFDISEEFDEHGNLIEYFDNNQKFGRIMPMDVVRILEKEGWFNRETGEQKIIPGIERLPTNGEFTAMLDSTVLTFDYNQDKQLWKVFITLRNGPSRTPVLYNIDGNTGEFTKVIGKAYIRRQIRRSRTR